MSRADRAHRAAIRKLLKDAPSRDASPETCRRWYADARHDFEDLRARRTSRRSVRDEGRWR